MLKKLQSYYEDDKTYCYKIRFDFFDNFVIYFM